MTKIDRDLDQERRVSELVGAFSQPASVYFSQNTPSQHSTDTISKSTAAAASKNRSLPVLDAPEDAGAEIFEEGVDGLDDLVYALYLASQQVFSDRLSINRTFFDAERAISNDIEKDRAQAIHKEIETSRRVNVWNTLEKSISSLGLIAAGVAGIGLGAPLLGAAAIAVGTLFIIDQLLDDAAKKVVATWIARGDQEDEQRWRERLQFFCTATSFAMSLGLAAPAAVKFGLTAAKTAAGGVKNFYEWRANEKRACMLALEAAATMSQKNINRLMSEIQFGCDDLRQLNKQIHDLEENNHKLASAMLMNLIRGS